MSKRPRRQPYQTPDHILKVMPPHLDPNIFGKYFNENGQKLCWMCKKYKDPIKDFYRQGRETRCKKCDAIKIKRARARKVKPNYVLNSTTHSPKSDLAAKSAAKVRALARKLGVSIWELYLKNRTDPSGVNKAWYNK